MPRQPDHKTNLEPRGVGETVVEFALVAIVITLLFILIGVSSRV